MSIKNITNPVYFDLLKLNLINKKNIIKISEKTRDKNIKVYKDKKTQVIFLEKMSSSSKRYYNSKKTDNKRLLDKSQNLIYKKKEILLPIIDDDTRRYLLISKISKNKEILDFGCGWGSFLFKIKNSKSKFGVELRRECRNYINMIDSNITINENLNDLDKKFDIITLFHTLEHIPQQVSTLKKLKKKLKKNGKLIIEVPHAKDILLNLKSFRNFTFFSEHLILHTKQSLKKLLVSAGFKDVKIRFHQRYNFANHLGWFLNNKPGGHTIYNKSCESNLLKNYKKFLIKNEISDTLIAIAV